MDRESDEELIRELLMLWEESVERGQPLSAGVLCAGCPELLEELERRIASLRDWDGLPPNSSSGASTAPYDGPPEGMRLSARMASRLLDLRFLAQGGLGEVYKARHEELGRDVALKFLRGRHAGEPDSRRRFLREAEIAARLEHPGIVPIYGLGRD